MKNQKWTPELLIEQLKKSVIGQDRYLKDLCTSVWIHNLKKESEERTGIPQDGPKPNLLVIGKSGTGKTLAVQTLAKLLNLNFVIEDASMFTGAGWKGRDANSIAKDLFISTGGNRKKAEYSIVVLDEIDKLFLDTRHTGSFSAVNNFLKLIEGTKIEYIEDNNCYSLDTKNILFICLGAFEGLDEIIRRRIQKTGRIGFCSASKEIPKQNLLQDIQQEDLIAYGVNPQFLGRIAGFTVTNELTEEDFFHILTKSNSSVIYKYNALLETSMGVSVRITLGAARALAHRAIKEQTGARILLFEITKVLKDGLCQISARPDVKELRIIADSNRNIALQFMKGERKNICQPVKKISLIPKKKWQKISINLSKYHHSLSGACQCAEDMAEELELSDCLLSENYSYRRIKAAVCLISCAILFILATDMDETIYDVASVMKMVVENPPLCRSTYERKDIFASMYWKSISYEEKVSLSLELAMYILQEYCRYQFEKEQENKEVS